MSSKLLYPRISCTPNFERFFLEKSAAYTRVNTVIVLVHEWMQTFANLHCTFLGPDSVNLATIRKACTASITTCNLLQLTSLAREQSFILNMQMHITSTHKSIRSHH